MDLKEAVAVAKKRVAELCAPGIPHNVRLENFLYDDHSAIIILSPLIIRVIVSVHLLEMAINKQKRAGSATIPAYAHARPVVWHCVIGD
jgi:hypothetical protein